jgi:hypothetical protein
MDDPKIVFGLKNQGHIPIIQKMLVDGKNWEEIGEEINWCPKTAREYYERYCWDEGTIEKNILPTLAAAVGWLEEYKKILGDDIYSQNRLTEIIHHANRVLKSANAVIAEDGTQYFYVNGKLQQK